MTFNISPVIHMPELDGSRAAQLVFAQGPNSVGPRLSSVEVRRIVHPDPL